jgi:hypothetical protein
MSNKNYAEPGYLERIYERCQAGKRTGISEPNLGDVFDYLDDMGDKEVEWWLSRYSTRTKGEGPASEVGRNMRDEFGANPRVDVFAEEREDGTVLRVQEVDINEVLSGDPEREKGGIRAVVYLEDEYGLVGESSNLENY